MELIRKKSKGKAIKLTPDQKSCDERRLLDLPKLPPRAHTNVGGDSHFPDANELRRFLNPPADEKYPVCLHGMTALLEKRGTSEYQVFHNATLYLPQDVMRRNVAVFGQIGSGNTQKAMIPLMESEIRDPEKSLVVLGTKGDEYDVLCNLAEELRPGARVECLNLADAARSTLGWNPLASVGASNRSGAARVNAEIWIDSAMTSGPNDAPFFKQTATRLIAGLILLYEEHFGIARPFDIFELLESGSGKQTVFKYAKKGDNKFLSDFWDCLENNSSNIQTAVAEAQNGVQHLIDADLAATTSQNDFKFENLFDEPTILVLEVSQDAIIKTRPFINMFFAQLFDAIARRAKKSPNRELPRPLSIYIYDFAASVGRIPECAQRLNMLRSMNARVVLALQSMSQLEHCYFPGESEAIIAACNTKIFAPPTSLADARYASDYSGFVTLLACDGGEVNVSRRRVGFARDDVDDHVSQAPASAGYSTTSRALLLPSDVLYSPKDENMEQAVTIFLPGLTPFQAWIPYAYQIPSINEALDKAREVVRVPNGVNVTVESRLEAIINVLSQNEPTSEAAFSGDIEKLFEQVGGKYATDPAKKWWDEFKRLNYFKKPMIRQFLQELI